MMEILRWLCGAEEVNILLMGKLMEAGYYSSYGLLGIERQK
jgi:hypothetical protein